MKKMNTKNRSIKSFVVIAGLSASLFGLNPSALAQGHETSGRQAPPSNGGGLRDGGHIVRENGQARLLDYIERGGCQTRTTGAELLAALPELSRMMTALKRVDWLFAHALESEISSLEICMGDSLSFVRPRDTNGMFRPEPDQNLRQAAVRLRWSPYVYADLRVINALPAMDYAGVWIHEALHTFIGFRDGRHYEHVRSVNRAIRDLTRSGSTDRPAFHRVLDEAGVYAPRASAQLDRYQYAFDFAWSSSSEKIGRVLQAQAPESLVMSDEIYLSLIPQFGELLPLTPMAELIQTLQTLLIDGSNSEFETILTQKTYSNFSIGDIALELIPRLSPEKRQRLFALLGSPNGISLSIIDNVSAQFAEAGAYVRNSRICANMSLRFLSNNLFNSLDRGPGECLLVMTLNAQYQNRGEATTHALGAAAQWIRELVIQGEWEMVTSLVAPQGRLKAAFSLNALVESIAALPESSVSIRREKRYATERVSRLQSQIWADWVRTAALGMNDSDRARFFEIAGVRN